MLTIKSYLNNPCGMASIPYWKQKGRSIPDNMKIVHDRDYDENLFCDYKDEPYFRLYHDLKSISKESLANVEIITSAYDIEQFVKLINKSYSDLSVTEKQLEGYQKTPVFCPELWVLLKETSTEKIIAGGIADYDKEIGELILEWIQVMPDYRGKGYGQLVVNYLLSKMQGIAEFATVSGKVNNSTNPEALYRRCGFTGNDIWHILTK